MRSTDLESKLKQYFIDVYEVQYTRELPVDVEGINYTTTFYLGGDWRRPLLIQGEFENDDQYLIFMKKEIDTRRLQSVWFSKLEKQLDSIYGETTDKQFNEKWKV